MYLKLNFNGLTALWYIYYNIIQNWYYRHCNNEKDKKHYNKEQLSLIIYTRER